MTNDVDSAPRLEPLVRPCSSLVEDITDASRREDYDDDMPGFDPLDSDDDDWRDI